MIPSTSRIFSSSRVIILEDEKLKLCWKGTSSFPGPAFGLAGTFYSGNAAGCTWQIPQFSINLPLSHQLFTSILPFLVIYLPTSQQRSFPYGTHFCSGHFSGYLKAKSLPFAEYFSVLKTVHSRKTKGWLINSFSFASGSRETGQGASWIRKWLWSQTWWEREPVEREMSVYPHVQSKEGVSGHCSQSERLVGSGNSAPFLP